MLQSPVDKPPGTSYFRSSVVRWDSHEVIVVLGAQPKVRGRMLATGVGRTPAQAYVLGRVIAGALWSRCRWVATASGVSGRCTGTAAKMRGMFPTSEFQVPKGYHVDADSVQNTRSTAGGAHFLLLFSLLGLLPGMNCLHAALLPPSPTRIRRQTRRHCFHHNGPQPHQMYQNTLLSMSASTGSVPSFLQSQHSQCRLLIKSE